MTSPFFLFVLFVCFNVTGQPNISAQEDQAEKPLVAVYTLANKHFADGEYPQALAHAKQLCQRKPDEFRFHFLRGEVSFANGDMKESVAAFDEVIRLQPRMERQFARRRERSLAHALRRPDIECGGRTKKHHQRPA
jgi:predicted Zn-dependent protease